MRSSFNRGLDAIVRRVRFIQKQGSRNLGELAFHVGDHHVLDLELSHGSAPGRSSRWWSRFAVLQWSCVLMVALLFNCIDIIHIDIDIFDIEYNGKDSLFMVKFKKSPRSPSCLANHAEGLAIDVPLRFQH